MINAEMQIFWTQASARIHRTANVNRIQSIVVSAHAQRLIYVTWS